MENKIDKELLSGWLSEQLTFMSSVYGLDMMLVEACADAVDDNDLDRLARLLDMNEIPKEAYINE